MSIEQLRTQLINDLEALYFIGGLGGAIITREDVITASPERLIEIAKLLGYDINFMGNSNPKEK